jgi:plastocyanin
VSRLRGVLAACISLAAACGSPAPVATTTTVPERVGPIHHGILVSAFAFSTQRVSGDTTVLEVPKGDIVSWFNVDATTHRVASGTPPTTDGKFGGDVPPKTGTFDLTFNEAGAFKYFCSIHNSMTGTIVVK